MLLKTHEVPTLTDLEWQVVKVAMRDATAGHLVAPTRRGSIADRLGRIYSFVTGIKPIAPLADPRLEALRRFVFVTRRTRVLAEAEVPGLLDLGFTRAQVVALATLAS